MHIVSLFKCCFLFDGEIDGRVDGGAPNALCFFIFLLYLFPLLDD